MARIDDFRAQLIGGGARASHFNVILTFPGVAGVSADVSQKASFMCRSTSLPASRMIPIEVPFRGRTTKVAGERIFDNWNVVIYNDNDFSIKNAMERWSATVLNHAQTNGIVNPNVYQSTMTVQQLDRNDAVLKVYNFYNCFPLNISDIQLDYSNTAQIEEFSVEFSVDYWTAADSTDSSGPSIPLVPSGLI